MSTQRITITAIEGREGISSKTGKPYSMATITVPVLLAKPQDGAIAGGTKTRDIRCESLETLKPIAHLAQSLPIDCDVEIVHELRMGTVNESVRSITPVSQGKKAA